MQSVLCGAGWRFLAVSTTLAVACDQSGSRDVNDARTQRSARPCRPARTATELTNAVGKGIGNANWAMGESLTPPLPARWPDARSGGVVFLTYTFLPLPTGRVAARVRVR